MMEVSQTATAKRMLWRACHYGNCQWRLAEIPLDGGVFQKAEDGVLNWSGADDLCINLDIMAGCDHGVNGIGS